MFRLKPSAIVLMLVVLSLTISHFSRLANPSGQNRTPDHNVAVSGGPLVVADLDSVLQDSVAVLLISGRQSTLHIHCESQFSKRIEVMPRDLTRNIHFAILPFNSPGGPTWNRLMGWWDRHSLKYGSMKDWGSQGSIVWIKDGVPVRQHFCRGLPDTTFWETTAEVFYSPM